MNFNNSAPQGFNSNPYDYAKPRKNYVVALLLSIFLGGLGVDRFYLGHIGLGIAKLLVTIFSLGTIGFVWWIIDLILIATRKINHNNFVWDDM